MGITNTGKQLETEKLAAGFNLFTTAVAFAQGGLEMLKPSGSMSNYGKLAGYSDDAVAVGKTTQNAVGAAKSGTSLVQANRIAGNAFRDGLAAGLKAEGRQVSTEVFKRTPFGARYIDIEVSQGGKVLGGIEAKVGNSPYTSLQRLKDVLLDTNTPGGYPVQLVRRLPDR